MIGTLEQRTYLAPEERPPLWVGVPARPKFVEGRAKLLDTLVKRIQLNDDTRLALVGIPGVGKTTTAILLAHQLRSYFVDGVLWEGLGPQADIGSITSKWGSVLMQNGGIGQKGLLVILDDVWQANVSRELLNFGMGGPKVSYILTTRNDTIANEFAGKENTVRIPTLDVQAAWRLLCRLAPKTCETETESTRALIDAVGGLPLVIELLGGYLGNPENESTVQLRKVALEEMGDTRRRLALAKERLGSTRNSEETVEAIIQLSVDELQRVAPEAVDLFWNLGAFAPSPATFSIDSVVSVAKTSYKDVARLISRNLLQIEGEGTLSIHQVLSSVAKQRMAISAEMSHTEYFISLLHCVDNPDDLLANISGSLEQIKLALLRLVEGEGRDDVFAVLQRYRVGANLATINDRLSIAVSLNLGTWGRLAEATHLVAMSRTAAERSTNRRLAEIYLQLSGWLRDEMELSYDVEDVENFARLTRLLGDGWSFIATFFSDESKHIRQEQAARWYKSAKKYYRQVGVKAGETTTLNNIGRVYDDLGAKRQALDYYEQARHRQRQVGDKGGEAMTLTSIGAVYDALGDKRQALDYFEQALPLSRQVGDKGGEATTLNNIGGVYDALGEKAKALEYYEQALPLFRQVGDKGGEAMTLNNIGGAYDALGKKAKALDHYEQALPLQRQVDNKGGEAITLNNIGYILWQEDRAEEVIETLRQIVTITQEIGDVSGESAFHTNLAVVLHSMGRTDEAIRYVEASIAVLRRSHLPQDSSGQTIDEKRAFLAELTGEPPAPSQDTGISLGQLCDLVVQARQGDANLSAELMPGLQQMAADDRQDPALRRFFAVLVDILAGTDTPDLSGLSPELTEDVEGILATLADQRSD